MKNTVTESLVRALEKQLSGKQLRRQFREDESFVKAYFHRLSRQDFSENQALCMYEIAIRHRSLGATRKPGQTLIEIYNQISANCKDNDASLKDDAPGTGRTIVTIITEDKPFIFSSLVMKLNELAMPPMVLLHPILSVTRNKKHQVTEIEKFRDQLSDAKSQSRHYVESYIQIQIDYIPEKQHRALHTALTSIISQIGRVCSDWKPMSGHTTALAEIAETSRGGPVFSEYGPLLHWLTKDNFAFLGYCELSVKNNKSGQKITIEDDSALGIFADENGNPLSDILDFLPPIRFGKTSPMVFTKTRRSSQIHRPRHMDCILFNHGFTHDKTKKTDRRTNPSKVTCIVGFLSGSSSMLPTTEIPHLRNKTNYVLEQSGLRKGGYGYKQLRNTLENLPRRQLFQMDIKSLFGLSMTLLNQERRKTRVHLHRNLCGHFYSCLVYVPRDLFNSSLREEIQDHLKHRLGADQISFDVYFSESILTRIHYLAYGTDPASPTVDPVALEQEIQHLARDWNEQLRQSLRIHHGIEQGNSIFDNYANAFDANYKNYYETETAINDIAVFAQMKPNEICARIHPSSQSPDSHNHASFRLYSSGHAIALSDVLPILEHMGVRVLGERPFEVSSTRGQTILIRDFEIARKDSGHFNFKDKAALFEETFIHASTGTIENDGYNQLTLLAELSARQISLIRAYYRYLKQIRLRYSENYIIDALASNPILGGTMVSLFESVFDPHKNTKNDKRIDKRNTLYKKVKNLLDQTHTIDEERIFRAWLDVMKATSRTNYFQTTTQGDPKPYISLKLDSSTIPRIPEPAPKYEIFTYSPRVEGVHLRGGKVARGGLRWSERLEDFRTEVLGLVKAQRVKNAVIVPVGSKGGFVAKQLPQGDRAGVADEVIACYQIFIKGLLDITDNLVGADVVPPENVVRIDGDDPYLVVAADKGTATFSDTANGISQAYGFWLGDAFASGGSVGYDHKKMGITARGAWESVKRHFRELGKDIMSEDFTAIGIGDMAGDVFGNGMLLSRRTKLLAAFNHLHIFIDPNPDPKASYKERQRLFKLKGSSWTDYNESLISSGGGVYSRASRVIELSENAACALGIKQDKYTPDALIHEILKADVELLWNGGIGTYIKASTETHADAQDKANDVLRVDATELRCKVVGEGGNLGVSQLGRIEFAQHGGLIYTDAIDNSAGVDTSDHEVNIKILLNAAMEEGALPEEQRNPLLAQMESDIAQLVLRNNYVQTQTISIEASLGDRASLSHARALEAFEDKGLLNRELEFLPDSATLENRRAAGQGLVKPELSVLLSYSKMDLYQSLLEVDLLESDYFNEEILNYFPDVLSARFPSFIRSHRLKKEIIATQVANSLIGTMGPAFHVNLHDLTGASAQQVTKAYIAARDITQTDALRQQVESLDNKIEAQTQAMVLSAMTRIIREIIVFILQNVDASDDIQSLVDQYQRRYQGLVKQASSIRSAFFAKKFDRLMKQFSTAGIPKDIAQNLVGFIAFERGLDILSIAEKADSPAKQVAQIYFELDQILGIYWLQNKTENLDVASLWHERAQHSLKADLRQVHRDITLLVLKGKSKGQNVLASWRADNASSIDYIHHMIASIDDGSDPDFAMLSVIVSELNRLR